MPKTYMEETDASERVIRPPYRTPSIQRVDLALEETLSSGCKTWGEDSPCGEDAFSAGFDDGS